MYDIIYNKGGVKMAYTQASNKAVQKYSAKAYDQVKINVYKGQREQIKAYAESRGMSLNGYINKLIADDMGEALTVPDKQQD